jgi:putative redox protein
MTSQIIYKGELRTSATHIQSGTVIETDAPTDNMGKGERFSPTDLVAVALATCMVTTMAIKTQATMTQRHPTGSYQGHGQQPETHQ